MGQIIDKILDSLESVGTHNNDGTAVVLNKHPPTLKAVSINECGAAGQPLPCIMI